MWALKNFFIIKTFKPTKRRVCRAPQTATPPRGVSAPSGLVEPLHPAGAVVGTGTRGLLHLSRPQRCRARSAPAPQRRDTAPRVRGSRGTQRVVLPSALAEKPGGWSRRAHALPGPASLLPVAPAAILASPSAAHGRGLHGVQAPTVLARLLHGSGAGDVRTDPWVSIRPERGSRTLHRWLGQPRRRDRGPRPLISLGTDLTGSGLRLHRRKVGGPPPAAVLAAPTSRLSRGGRGSSRSPEALEARAPSHERVSGFVPRVLLRPGTSGFSATYLPWTPTPFSGDGPLEPTVWGVGCSLLMGYRSQFFSEDRLGN